MLINRAGVTVHLLADGRVRIGVEVRYVLPRVFIALSVKLHQMVLQMREL